MKYEKVDYYISVHHMKNMKIAIKNVTDFISPYKQTITETLSIGLHLIADAMTIIHMSGIHLRGPLKYLSQLT